MTGPSEYTYLAQVIHWAAPPVSEEMVLVEQPYGGQATSISILDFTDERVSALLHADREADLIQAVHRARLATLGTPGEQV